MSFREPEPATFTFKISADLPFHKSVNHSIGLVEGAIDEEFGKEEGFADVENIKFKNKDSHSVVRVSAGSIVTEQSMAEVENRVEDALRSAIEGENSVSRVACVDLIP
jgi:hypothetical protein